MSALDLHEWTLNKQSEPFHVCEPLKVHCCGIGGERLGSGLCRSVDLRTGLMIREVCFSVIEARVNILLRPRKIC